MEATTMGKKVRAAIYVRVSTEDQHLDGQEAELEEYVRNRGWEVTKVYRDKISGVKTSRPALDELMADSRKRRMDIILVWRFDRFARSVSHLLQALESFRTVGIEFVSISEQVDTSTPTGKMVFTVLGAVAELERSLIGERVRSGLRNARANGKRLGRPPLRELTAGLVTQVKHDRRRGRMSFKRLAQKHGVSVWTAFQLCRKAKG
jgi:DNA invertase Pin-like site-specific DNA recombinase